MSSGNETMVFNPLERALSTDQMRLQSFVGKYASELARSLFDTSFGSDDQQAGGRADQTLTQNNPATAEIVSGFMFQPAVGSGACVVQGGELFIYDPDAAPSTDDSQYKHILDPGTDSTLTPGIALTPNSSGQIRIDVLECARVQPDNVIETDSRDIYNPTSQSFLAVSVPKVTQGQLTYRIRTGIGGSGFPGTEQGWLPLAVMSVPNGATTWDAVTIWDVRPMIEDRVIPPFNVYRTNPNYTRLDVATNSATSGQYRLNGLAEVANGARRLGGQLLRGSPGTDFSTYVDLYDSANQENAYSFPAGLSYIYLCTMLGLPRWARYTDYTSGARVPRSPRGIIVVSAVPPLHWQGYASAAIVLPAVYGFAGASTTNATCIGAVNQTSGSTFSPIVGANRAQAVRQPPTVTATSVSGSDAVFSLAENTAFPAGAKRIRVLVTLTYDVLATTYEQVVPVFELKNASDSSGGDGYAVQETPAWLSNPGGSTIQISTQHTSSWIPLQSAWPRNTVQTYTLTFLPEGGSIHTATTPTCSVVEWEF
jgi:hypothetical protein